MIAKTIRIYKDSFTGLSRPVWLLSAVMLINRSGTMVIPFLSVYLNTQMGFSMSRTGIVMGCFGAGSVAGALIGGKLTDTIGYYKVQQWSLFLTAFMYWSLLFMETFPQFCVAIFFTSLVADSLRPANLTAISVYSRTENRTRSFALVRLAINLGWSIGPAVGGFLAGSAGYHWLFILNGLALLGAGLFFTFFLDEKKKEEEQGESISGTGSTAKESAYRDYPFLLFTLCITIAAIAFLQLIFLIPVYYKTYWHLEEHMIGLLLTSNALLIFLFEMPFIHLADKRFSHMKLIALGTLLIGISYLVLNLIPWIGVLVIAMLFITVGEMVSFPFTNTVVAERARPKIRGQYMGVYTLSFSISSIVAPIIGFQLTDAFGYSYVWYLMMGLALIAAIGFLLLKNSFECTKETD